MALNEIIRTSGDVRRTLAQTLTDVRNGNLDVSRGLCVAALAKEITASMQVEVNVAKVRIAVSASGADLGKVTQLGRLVIEDSGEAPTLSGSSE